MTVISQDQAFALLRDQKWRMRNLYKIKDKEGNIVDFQPNWAQEALYESHNLNIILKARQLGACPPVVNLPGDKP